MPVLELAWLTVLDASGSSADARHGLARITTLRRRSTARTAVAEVRSRRRPSVHRLRRPGGTEVPRGDGRRAHRLVGAVADLALPRRRLGTDQGLRPADPRSPNRRGEPPSDHTNRRLDHD